MFGKFEKRMSGTQMIALGFLLLIFIGTILLMLPVSSRNGEWTPFITALFTSTSATCVTGLVLVDTFTHWSIFGQLVLLVLIQIGGLGFITIGITVSLILRKKIGLKPLKSAVSCGLSAVSSEARFFLKCRVHSF